MSDDMNVGIPQGRATAIVVPRWYMISLILVMAAAAVGCFVVGDLFFGIMFAALAVVTLIVALVIGRRARSRKLRQPTTSSATYGSSTLLGLLSLILGAYITLSWDRQVLPGLYLLAFGALTVGVFLPPFLRQRAARSER